MVNTTSRWLVIACTVLAQILTTSHFLRTKIGQNTLIGTQFRYIINRSQDILILAPFLLLYRCTSINKHNRLVYGLILTKV